MPDGRVAPDGTLRAGLSNFRPYRSGWVSLTALPRAEVSMRYVEINGLSSFGVNDPRSATYGDYKDKTFDAKFVLLTENGWVPNVAAGVQDFFGTGIFRGTYLAASKQLGPLDVTVGWGRSRFDGPFAGARLRVPGFERLSVVGEYDGYDYRSDLGARVTGVDRRAHGINTALEYRGDSYILQAGRSNGSFAFNAYVTVPLEKPEFVPKIDEPEPYTAVGVRPTEAEWRGSAVHVRTMLKELGTQDFRGIQLRYERQRLEATLTNVRISDVSRAIGRAARILVALGPEETREIAITYTVSTLPLATYTFTDVDRLDRYFKGLVTRKDLAETVKIEFAGPPAKDMRADERVAEVVDGLDETRTPLALRRGDSGDVFSLRSDDNRGNRFWFGPLLSTYLNDPSGAFRFSVAAAASVERRLAEHTFLRGLATWDVWEDVSDVTQPSNSLLPRVRSDIAEYKRGSRGKLAQLVVNHFGQPSERIYTRYSAGLYETMFAGFGGQVLYLPERGPWAVSFSADALQQRDFEGLFGFRDYRTVQALGAVHYRMPYDMTATLRAGRFLAKDEGARMELSRTFRSGFTIGAWYTRTNGNDITNPGSPGNPYFDKGVFMAFPLSPYLTKDTQGIAGFSLAPWTRDVGQMVTSPADLYAMVERPLYRRGVFKGDGLHKFGDVDDDYVLKQPQTFFDAEHGRLWKSDASGIVKSVGDRDFWDALVVASVLTAASSTTDRTIDRMVKPHADSSVANGLGMLSNLIPLGAGAVSAALSVWTGDDRLARTAYASLRSGVFALAANTAFRGGIGRARPDENEGAYHFAPFSKDAFGSSMPSNHVATAFAFVTPYAEEYDMPWLYALAGLTSVGRVAERNHWASDTVAGALLGYGVGRAVWAWNRDPRRRGPELGLTQNGVQARWELP